MSDESKLLTELMTTRPVTMVELDAIKREMEYLDPYTVSDSAWRSAAMSGRCFCAGRFQCTKHKFMAELA